MDIPIEGVDYFVHLTDFPKGCGCDGAVTLNQDGTYTVYLDSRTTRERNIKTIEHELNHITNDDFFNCKDIREIEDI